MFILTLECAMLTLSSLAMSILVILWRKKLLKKFYALAGFLLVLLLSNSISIVTLFFRKQLGIPKMLDYNIYACTSWVSACLEYAFVLMIIYGVFHQAMKPLVGLHRAGKVVFRWVYGVSLALVLGMSLGQHISESTFVSALTGQVQQGVCVLTLCLLLFVCLATRYLGLTFRSHIFGVSLGLGIWATVGLIEVAWYSTNGAQSLYSPVYVFSSVGACATLLVWGGYFALPEPAPKMVLLPTTSPYFLWNRISEALGDEPGFVAIAGFKPSMMAPAELKMLSKTAARDRALEEQEQNIPYEVLGNVTNQYASVAMQQ